MCTKSLSTSKKNKNYRDNVLANKPNDDSIVQKQILHYHYLMSILNHLNNNKK